MQWTDEAIILSARKFGENKAVARVFSKTHGVYGGVVRGAFSKANRGIVQPGNAASVTWNARLSEQLGAFKIEPVTPFAAHAMADKYKLAALSSACALLESALPERHPYPRLYEEFYGFLEFLTSSEDWLETYIKLELEILAQSGFGLDLKTCAATGSSENLRYVSPKSGRAVSASAGEPYKERLLRLPAFLTSPVRGEVEARSAEGGGKLHPQINKYGSHALIQNARELRSNMPEAEQKLWYHLRAHRFEGYAFRRQHPLSKYYIADFVCLDKKLIIELDGGQHSEQQDYDAKRTAFLERENYRVLRFWNNEVFENMEGVLTTILEALKSGKAVTPSRPPATLPPLGGGDIIDGLRLTGYFLESRLAAPHGRKLPAARQRLVASLAN